MVKQKNDVIADLHTYALKKGHCKEVAKAYDLRIKLSSEKAKEKAINIYVNNNAINRYKYIILMPCKSRLYLEPTNEYTETAYTICHKGNSHLVKVGRKNYDALKKYVGDHKVTLYITGDTGVYYLEV